MKTNILLYGVLATMLAAPFAGLAAAQGSPAGEKPKRAADEEWNPHQAAQPKNKEARALFKRWQHHARASGNIPGALIGELAAAVKTFIGYNPTWETTPKLTAMLTRFDATHDWNSADAIALLDEVAAAQDSPLSMAVERATRGTIREGEALPKKFADAPWGDAQPNGLRAAWVLEPGAAEHRIGAALSARLFVHNSGQVAVTLQVPTWHQGSVKASDAKGAELEVYGIERLTLATSVPVRLAPGEYIKINTPGVGLGPRAGMGPWAGPRIGSSVITKPGDDITLTHGLVPLDGSELGVREDDPHVVGPGWWLAHIKARLNSELPLPADAAERTRLLDRAVPELFATAPSAEETAAFVADKTPDALDALAKRLASRVDVVSFSGKLPTAPTKFRVRAADANADKQPRVVLGPGEYPVGQATVKSGGATLKIVGRPVRDRRMNDAQLMFEATEFTGILPPDPHKLEVPDGWATWAIVCRPGDGFFYLLHKGGVRKIDYSYPLKVTDTPANDLPAEFRDEVKRILDIHEIPEAQRAEFFKTAANTAPAPVADAPSTAALKPKHEYAQSLFRKWQESARTDGKIPGALIGHVGREVDGFLRQYPDDEKTPKLAALRPRLDVSRDWTQAEVVALLDDITAISTAPVSWADIPMEFWKATIAERIANEAPMPVFAADRAQLIRRVTLDIFGVVPTAEEIAAFTADDAPDALAKLTARLQAQPRVEPFSGKLPTGETKFRVIAADPDAAKAPRTANAPGRYALGDNVHLREAMKKAFDVPGAPVQKQMPVKPKDGEAPTDAGAPDAPAPKLRIERADVVLEKAGTIFLNGKEVTLDELKTKAAKDAMKWFTIDAGKDVPYAKVIEVVEALKAAGVTEFSFAEARLGDGKYRVANRQANYEFDGKHHFSICRPGDYPQWFTVSWPAEGGRPACSLRTYPNVSGQTQGKWAVVWEPGTDVLWWVDDSDVGKMTLTDPARVIVDREGRKNNFSRDFGLPGEVKTEFRRLGFEIGRDETPGLENAIGGNTGGQNIVSAEAGNWIVAGTVTDADGKPMKDVPVRVTTNQQLKTERTDEKGKYRAYFSLPIQLLAKWRAVTVEPVLEGFTERELAKAGEFNALLRVGEQPQRVRLAGEPDFQPGPVPLLAERDLLSSQPGVSPGTPGRADFVMLKAGEITGEIVTADGKPAPPHWVAAAAPEQRPGHHAAIELSDDKGRFRLKGIPTNKPVVFTVNPDGKPGETSKSSEQKFERTGAQKIRIILPAEGSGLGPVKIERLADGAGAAASGAIRGKVLKPDGSPAASVQVRVDDGSFDGVLCWAVLMHVPKDDLFNTLFHPVAGFGSGLRVPVDRSRRIRRRGPGKNQQIGTNLPGQNDGLGFAGARIAANEGNQPGIHDHAALDPIGNQDRGSTRAVHPSKDQLFPYRRW